jgi:hypothetical protein
MRRLPLADELFLAAHHCATGRPILTDRVHGLALSGALLGELVHQYRIEVKPAQQRPGAAVPPPGATLHVIDSTPPQDRLPRSVLEQMISEPHHRLVREWLAYLARRAEDLSPPEREYLRAQLRRLPPSLRELVAETEAAIGGAVLSYRS